MTTIQEFNQIDGRISSLYHAAALKMGLSDSEFRILYTLAVNAPAISSLPCGRPRAWAAPPSIPL